MITVGQLVEAFPDLLKLSIGSPDTQVKEITLPDLATEGSLVFAASPKHLSGALSSKASIIITSEESDESSGKVILKSSNPYLAVAHCLERFFPNEWVPDGTPQIHPSAVVSAKSKIGEGVHIAANSVIHDGVSIGDGCIIGENSVINAGTSIGKNSHIFPFVLIGRDSVLGEDCVIQSFSAIGSEGFGYAPDSKNRRTHIPHKGRVVLGDRVEIGANTTFDRGTFGDSKVGDDTKIDNHCHFGHNVVIGQRCVFAGNFMTAGSTTIGDDFLAGGGCAMSDHLTITNQVTFASKTIALSDVTQPGIYGGHPIVSFGESRKNLVASTKLNEMRKNISSLMKAVFKD